MSKPLTHNSNAIDFLETWEFSSQEWHSFLKTATELKKEDNIYIAIAFLILGIPFLMLVRGTTFLMATAIVAPLAILISWLRYNYATSYLKLKHKVVKIHFHPDYILINDKKIDINNKNRWIKNMKIVDNKKGLKLLEIDIAWRTRKGNTFDETRIPIPANKLERTQALIEFYSKYI